MKALSLWQPWASFIALGVKPFETRSWAPPAWLIGQRIAIHAAKHPIDADDRDWARRAGVVGKLPLGAIVCTAILRGAYRSGGEGSVVNAVAPVICSPVLAFDLPEPPLIIKGIRIASAVPRSPMLMSLRADEFGDYAEGRWAWHLTSIMPIDPPIPERGRQGLWDIDIVPVNTSSALVREPGE